MPTQTALASSASTLNSKSPESYRTISEAAIELNLPQHVLRFWETRFNQIRPMKRSGGRRFYRPEDLDFLQGIKYFLYGQGLTIRGLQKIIKEQGINHVIRTAQAFELPRGLPAEKPVIHLKSVENTTAPSFKQPVFARYLMETLSENFNAMSFEKDDELPPLKPFNTNTSESPPPMLKEVPVLPPFKSFRTSFAQAPAAPLVRAPAVASKFHSMEEVAEEIPAFIHPRESFKRPATNFSKPTIAQHNFAEEDRALQNALIELTHCRDLLREFAPNV